MIGGLISRLRSKTLQGKPGPVQSIWILHICCESHILHHVVSGTDVMIDIFNYTICILSTMSVKS